MYVGNGGSLESEVEDDCGADVVSAELPSFHFTTKHESLKIRECLHCGRKVHILIHSFEKNSQLSTLMAAVYAGRTLLADIF